MFPPTIHTMQSASHRLLTPTFLAQGMIHSSTLGSYTTRSSDHGRERAAGQIRVFNPEPMHAQGTSKLYPAIVNRQH